MTPQVRQGIQRWIRQAAVGSVGYLLIIFLPAGRLDWVWGWAQFAVLVMVLAAHPLILIPINPELLAERQKGIHAEGVKAWDKWLTTLAGGLMFIPWIIAGLDLRFGWTQPVLPLWLHLGGLVFHILGYALFMWAMACNAFFSEGVRIQEERGHTVATGGPYQVVRHPGYAGAIIAALATPFLLGSLWGLIPASLTVAVFTVRTALEDRTLLEELPGYQEFAQETRWRLLPLIW
jgi:protein-S-isoprenylcysteine O-methyltransferase Ste14